MKSCKMTDCPAPSKSLGYCFNHYARLRRHGDPAFQAKRPLHAPTCSVDGCGKPYSSKGMCRNHRMSAYYYENKPAARVNSRKQARTFKGRFNQLKAGARARSKNGRIVAVELTLQQYISIVSSPCHYCAGALPVCGGGIDRVNSDLGYSVNNCVPCCKTCNYMKSSTPVTEWLDHLQKILDHAKKAKT